jgi:hypothetical protein
MANPEDANLGELILYIAQRSEADATYGMVKLNKLLFFADFEAFALLGGPISGAEYQRLPFGPGPRRMLPVLDGLQAAGAAAIQRTVYYGRKQERVIPLRDPDLTAFTGEQIALVDRILDRFRGMDGTAISEYSHGFQGWQEARDGESIPYESVFGVTSEIPEEALRIGRELTRKLAGG